MENTAESLVLCSWFADRSDAGIDWKLVEAERVSPEPDEEGVSSDSNENNPDAATEYSTFVSAGGGDSTVEEHVETEVTYEGVES